MDVFLSASMAKCVHVVLLNEVGDNYYVCYFSILCGKHGIWSSLFQFKVKNSGQLEMGDVCSYFAEMDAYFTEMGDAHNACTLGILSM